MFAHIRRHQKWLWIFISGAVIISFVWYFNPNQRYSRRSGGGFGGEDTVGTMYGEPIHRNQYTEAYREAILHYLFQYGEWPQDNEMTRQLRPVERETRQRLLLIRKMKDLDIEVNDKAVADWIAQAFQDRDTHTFRPEIYERFIQNIEQRRLKRADFERYAKHQVGIAHLAAIAGASGRLVTPQQAEQVYREEHEKADTKVAVLTLSNFVAKVQVTPEAIAQYYSNNIARYRLPDRMQLSYVPFPASNYMAKAEEVLAANTNLAQQIDAMYLQRGPDFYKDLNGTPMTPETAKAKIRDEAKKDAAMIEARKDAFAFANELEQIPVKTNSPNPAETLEALAKTKTLQARTTEPFSQFQGPLGLRLPDQFTRAAFRLTPEEPIVQEPVQGEDGFYVMALRAKIPESTQPLDVVHAQVMQDYQRDEASKMARATATAFLTAVTNSAANSETFTSLAQKNGLNVADLAPFGKDSKTHLENVPAGVSEPSLRSRAFDLVPGHASSYLPTADGGFIVYLEKFIPVTEDEVKTETPRFLEELRKRNAAEAFNDWFGKQIQMAQLHLPGDKTEQEMPE